MEEISHDTQVRYLQEQGVDADDPRLWNGRQEVVFYSEGENRKL